jgi:hypothetical protein
MLRIFLASSLELRESVLPFLAERRRFGCWKIPPLTRINHANTKSYQKYYPIGTHYAKRSRLDILGNKNIFREVFSFALSGRNREKLYSR